MVPPEQSVGAEACGPNTLKVTGPEGTKPPVSAASTDEVGIIEPAVPEEGPARLRDGLAGPTTVSVIPIPHVEADAVLFESPP